MATSIVERIAQAVATQLATITAANGYDNTVSDVIRPRRTGENYKPLDKNVVLMQQDAERDTENVAAGYPAGYAWKQSFTVDGIVRQSESSTLPMDQVLNSFVADIQKAIMEDVHWGGLAMDTELTSVEYPEPAQGFEGATIWFDVTLRVKENDPYTQV